MHAAPAPHVSPVVQSLPSSHAAPTVGAHADGAPVQAQQVSTWQVALQPSPAPVPPSSHVSPASTTPSPHMPRWPDTSAAKPIQWVGVGASVTSVPVSVFPSGATVPVTGSNSHKKYADAARTSKAPVAGSMMPTKSGAPAPKTTS